MPEVVAIPRLDREPIQVKLLDKGSARIRQTVEGYTIMAHPQKTSKHAIAVKLIFEK